MSDTLLRPFTLPSFVGNRGIRELSVANARLIAGLRSCCEETTANGLKFYAAQAIDHLQLARRDFIQAARVVEEADRPVAAAAAAEAAVLGTLLESGIAERARKEVEDIGRFMLHVQQQVDRVWSELSAEPQSALMARAQETALNSPHWRAVTQVLSSR